MRGNIHALALLIALLAIPVLGTEESGANAHEAQYFVILEKNPWNETALERLWAMCATPDDRARLLGEFEKISERLSTGFWPLAVAAQRLGRLSLAAAQIERIEASPMNARQQIAVGQLWSQLGQQPRAIRSWERALESAPDDESARKAIAGALAQSGETARAIPHWEALTKSRSPAVRLEALEALAQIEPDPQKAAQREKEALKMLAPNHWKYRDVLEATVARHERAGLLGALREEWSQEAETPDRNLRLASIARAEGHSEEAARLLERIHDPPSIEVLREIAHLRNSLADSLAAEEAWRAVLSARPDDGQALEELVRKLLDRGADEQASALVNQFFHDVNPDKKIAFLRKFQMLKAWEAALRERLAQQPGKLEAVMELAEFLATNFGYPDAMAVLDGFAYSPDADQRRRQKFQVARFYRQQRLFAKSVGILRSVLAEEPGKDPETRLLLAEVEELSGDRDTALQVLLDAAGPTQGDVSPELDQYLLSLMQRRDAGEDASLKNLGARAHRLAMESSARETRSAPLYARAGRWALWLGEPREALASFSEALVLDPGNPGFTELRVEALEKLGDLDAGIAALTELAAISPTTHLTYRIAHMEIARGNAETAVKILRRLADEQPTDPEAHRELAQARQSAGQNFEALNSWLRAWELTPPSERNVLLPSILRMFVKLRQGERALDFIESAASAAPNDAERLILLRQGSALAREMGILDDWKKRLSTRAADTHKPGMAWSLALSDFPSVAAKSPEKAVPVPGGESRDALTLLLQQAQAAGDHPQSLRFAEALSLLPDAEFPDTLRFLNALNDAGEIGRAAELSKNLPGKFPRMPDAHLIAARQFAKERRISEELDSLRTASRLGPLPPEALLRLIRDPETEREEALGMISQILRRYPPDPSPAATRFPFPVRLANLGMTNPPKSTDPQGARFLALAEAGKILAHSPQREARLGGLTDADALPIESAWAWWGARDIPRVIAILQASSDAEHAESVNLAIAALSLDSEEVGILSAWIAKDPAPRWEAVSSLLAPLIQRGWEPGPQEEAFWADFAPAHLRHQLAESLAREGKLRQALRVPVGENQKPQMALDRHFQRAGWLLILREPDAATQELEAALREGAPTESLAGAWYAALRAWWLLENPDRRVEIEALARRCAAETGNRAAGPATEIVLALLNDDTASIRKFADSWIRAILQSPPSEASTIESSLSTLETWNRPRAQREILRALLSRQNREEGPNPALPPAREMENRLAASRILDAPDSELKFLIQEWMARRPPPADLIALAAHAQRDGKFPPARALLEAAYRKDPSQPQLWRVALTLPPPENAPHFAVNWFLNAPPSAKKSLPPDAAARLIQNLSATGHRQLARKVLDAYPGTAPQIEALRKLTAADSTTTSPPVHTTALFEQLLPEFAAVHSAEEAQAALTSLQKRSAAERLRLTDLLISMNRELAQKIGAEALLALVSDAGTDPTLTAAWLHTRYQIAKATGGLESLGSELTRTWNQGHGAPLAGNLLLEMAVAQNSLERVPSLVREWLMSPHATTPALTKLARWLMSQNLPQEALPVFERLDQDGIADYSLALSYAEALWKSGRFEESLQITHAQERVARIDPALRIALAAHFLATGRPHEALGQLNNSDQPVGSWEAGTRLRALADGQLTRKHPPPP